MASSAAAAAAAAEGEWGWMAEVAGEELAKLEAEHPGRFGSLKAELKRLIADPGAWDAAATPLVSPDGAAATTTTTTCSSTSSHSASVLRIISTQESSSRKRRCGCNGGGGEQEGKRRRSAAAAAGKDRAEMAIERAVRCLKRIRAFKASLLSFSD